MKIETPTLAPTEAWRRGAAWGVFARKLSQRGFAPNEAPPLGRAPRAGSAFSTGTATAMVSAPRRRRRPSRRGTAWRRATTNSPQAASRDARRRRRCGSATSTTKQATARAAQLARRRTSSRRSRRPASRRALAASDGASRRAPRPPPRGPRSARARHRATAPGIRRRGLLEGVRPPPGRPRSCGRCRRPRRQPAPSVQQHDEDAAALGPRVEPGPRSRATLGGGAAAARRAVAFVVGLHRETLVAAASRPSVGERGRAAPSAGPTRRRRRAVPSAMGILDRCARPPSGLRDLERGRLGALRRAP